MVRSHNIMSLHVNALQLRKNVYNCSHFAQMEQFTIAKHRLGDAFRSTVSAFTSTGGGSKFLESGTLIPEEFVEAGDQCLEVKRDVTRNDFKVAWKSPQIYFRALEHSCQSVKVNLCSPF